MTGRFQPPEEQTPVSAGDLQDVDSVPLVVEVYAEPLYAEFSQPAAYQLEQLYVFIPQPDASPAFFAFRNVEAGCEQPPLPLGELRVLLRAW